MCGLRFSPLCNMSDSDESRSPGQPSTEQLLDAVRGADPSDAKVDDVDVKFPKQIQDAVSQVLRGYFFINDNNIFMCKNIY
jgi:hypothetical protein